MRFAICSISMVLVLAACGSEEPGGPAGETRGTDPDDISESGDWSGDASSTTDVDRANLRLVFTEIA